MMSHTQYPDAYVEYLYHFHTTRDYFECHEILEEFWKNRELSYGHPVWVGLIQIAVSMYHHRRGNFGGAIKMLSRAIEILHENRACLQELGLDHDRMIEQLEHRLHVQQQQTPYSSMNLPLRDEDLQRCCERLAESRGRLWQQPSDLNNPYLINKHTLRDRSKVIETRDKKPRKIRDDRMK